MGVMVTFDFSLWQCRYPEFGAVVEAQAQAYFDEATLYHRNDGAGPVRDPKIQLQLLNMLTAHIAFLNAPDVNGQPASTIVGRIQSASEGSVSVSSDYAGEQAASWYNQTKYGAAYWQATRVYRTMHYRRGWPRNMNPPFIFGRGGF